VSNGATARSQGVILWTRVRLCRNLAGHPFISDGRERTPIVDFPSLPAAFEHSEPSPSAEKRRTVYEKIEAALRELSGEKRMTLKPVTEIPDWKIMEYYERGVLSPYLQNHRDDESRGIITGAASSVPALVNEQHHLVLQDMRPGFQLERAWSETDRLDDLFSSKLKFAWSKSFGYLLPDSECCGTGLHVMVNAHLPVLFLLDELPQVASAFGAVGLHMDAEVSDDILVGGFGQFLRISNNMAVPDSEETVLDKMKQAVGDLMLQEGQARARVMEDPALKRDLCNRIVCSLSVAKNALLVSRADLYEHISWLRVGVQMGLVKGITVLRLDRLHRELWSSGYLAYFRGSFDEAVDHVGQARAMTLRERLTGVRTTFRH
jgi:protein-arginine kinase